MVNTLQNDKDEKLAHQYPLSSKNSDTWNVEQLRPQNTESLNDLLRSLRRKKGFGLFFVQCTPAQSPKIMEVVQKRFSNKKIEYFTLDRQSENLYDKLIEQYQLQPYHIACVSGVEQALYSYEDTKRLAGWTSKEIYNYSWTGTPELLNHLNRLRELFYQNLPVALIFFVPRFVIDYFVQRAPDFFDWRSGLFKFEINSDLLKKISQELVDYDHEKYSSLNSDQRIEKILKIKQAILYLGEVDCEKKSNLLRIQGQLFEANKDIFQALDCYDRAVSTHPKNVEAWSYKGLILNHLGRYEEAVESHQNALSIDCTNIYILNNLGTVFYNLGEYKKSINTYTRSININESYPAWVGKGGAFYALKDYKMAVSSYNSALRINAEDEYAWISRGIALHALEQYEDAIESYDHAINLCSSNFYIWFHRGNAFCCLTLYEDAINNFNSALEIDPENYPILESKAFALAEINRDEEALLTLDRMIEVFPTNPFSWRRRATILEKIGRHKEALYSYRKISEFGSDFFWNWWRQASGMYRHSCYEDAVMGYSNAVDCIQARVNKKCNWCWPVRYQAFEITFQSNPSYMAFYGRALAFFKLGQTREACMDLIRFIFCLDLYKDILTIVTAIIVALHQRKFKFKELANLMRDLQVVLGIRGIT